MALLEKIFVVESIDVLAISDALIDQ